MQLPLLCPNIVTWSIGNLMFLCCCWYIPVLWSKYTHSCTEIQIKVIVMDDTKDSIHPSGIISVRLGYVRVDFWTAWLIDNGEVFTAVLPRRAGFARGRCSSAGLSTRGLGAQPLAPNHSPHHTAKMHRTTELIQSNIKYNEGRLNLNKNSPKLIFTVSNVAISMVEG